jgi:phospholipid N-methyltransferase
LNRWFYLALKNFIIKDTVYCCVPLSRIPKMAHMNLLKNANITFPVDARVLDFSLAGDAYFLVSMLSPSRFTSSA